MKKPLITGCFSASKIMPPMVEDVMSTVKSRISWGSSVSPMALSLYQQPSAHKSAMS